jgi:hypothetical protein
MTSRFYDASTPKTVIQSTNKTKLLSRAAKTLSGYLLNLQSSTLSVTTDKYQALGVILQQLKSAKGTDFEYIRTTLVHALETLMALVNLYVSNKDLLTKFDQVVKQAKILDNIQTILAYLKTFSGSLFPDSIVTVTPAVVRQEYAIYLKRYGKPANGVFDVALLANILAEI